MLSDNTPSRYNNLQERVSSVHVANFLHGRSSLLRWYCSVTAYLRQPVGVCALQNPVFAARDIFHKNDSIGKYVNPAPSGLNVFLSINDRLQKCCAHL